MKHPFLMLTIPFILGILFCEYIYINSLYLFVCILIVLFSLIYSIIKDKNIIILIIMIMFLLGGFRLNISLNNSVLLKYKDENLELKGRIVEVLLKNDDYSRYMVVLEEFNSNNKSYEVKDKTILKVSGNIDLKVGDNIRFPSKIESPNKDKNPGSFNYKRYLKGENIYYLLSTRSNNIRVLSRGDITFLEGLVTSFRGKILSVTEEYIGIKYGGVISSILLGDTNYLNEKMDNAFRDLGVSHVFAVSGLHVGIITFFLFFIFNILRLNKKLSVIMVIVIIFLYGYLIGYPTSVLRASIMFAILILSTILHRRYDGVNIISLCAIFLLTYNPYYLFSLGFLLSFITTLSLVVLTNKIRYGLLKEYKVLGKYLSPIIAVQIGITPLLIIYFNKINLFAPLLNLIIIPLISLGIILSLIMILISFLSFKLTYIISKLLILILHFIDILVSSFYSLPMGNIYCGIMEIEEILIYYLVVMILFKIIDLRLFSNELKRVVFLYLVIVILFSMTFEIFDTKVYVDFIDVGQGDSALIRYKNNNFLIDTGGSIFGDLDVGKEIVLKYLRVLGINKLDGVFISHFHEDHAKGLLSIADEIKINRVFIGYKNKDNDIYKKIVNLVKNHDIELIELFYKDEILVRDNFSIKVIHPMNKILAGENENDLSLVLLLKANDKSILFTGDIEAWGEKEVSKNNEALNIDILKVSHHGSNTSSSSQFIKFVRPKYGVISVGKNVFGHPSKEVLNRYSNGNINILRTDKSGLIRVIVDDSNMTIVEHISDKYRLNDIIDNYSINIIIILIFVLILYIIILSNYRYRLDWKI